MKALPIVKREIDKLPRAYIANIIYTMTGDAFVKCILSLMMSRANSLLWASALYTLSTFELNTILQKVASSARLANSCRASHAHYLSRIFYL